MPVFNGAPFVEEAVESILAQTFADFEFIIIDDGSTDRSLELLQRYADRDHRIRLFSQSNLGIGRTRNKALSLATGEFLAVMDSDDVSLPDRFSKQVHYLRDNPDCAAVGCLATLIDSDGLPTSDWQSWRSHEEIDNAHMDGRGAP